MTVQVQASERDEMEIRSVIESMATFADRNAYDYLGRLFTDEVTTDYTSAFGGEPTTLSNVELMQQWAALLPGFDLTRHDLSNIEVDVKGDKATASADVTASHYLGDKGFWQISGSYRYVLEKTRYGWQISSLTLVAGPEKGDRDLLGKATERASQQQAPRLK